MDLDHTCLLGCERLSFRDGTDMGILTRAFLNSPLIALFDCVLMVLFSGFIGFAFEDICNPHGKNETPLDIAELWGLEGDDTYAKKREKRFKSANTWMHAEHTPLRMSIACTLLLPAVTLMSEFFHNAVWGNTDRGVLDFVSPTRNPVRRVIDRHR